MADAATRAGAPVRKSSASRGKVDPRSRRIALIHAGKRRLGLGDGEYRLLLRRVTGKGSSAELDLEQLDLVVDALRRLGFGVRPKRKLNPLQRKIVVLWAELGKAGVLRDRSDRALDRFVKRQTGVDAVQWLASNQAAQVVEALKGWRVREGIALA
ncbi:gp16 family protein [Benzoatithermus flavus]|uniref:Regulatory protein GemA n=1 Tax=Benzoatithermus flavus TaxID=3108223 RepID=A0ABU8XNW1_9PROT